MEAIWQTLEQNPGIRTGRVARELQLHRSSVARALPAMEEEGLLLSEDSRGRLWPWGRRK
jgi:Mn-dependent DtxR family transcriptional regulator